MKWLPSLNTPFSTSPTPPCRWQRLRRRIPLQPRTPRHVFPSSMAIMAVARLIFTSLRARAPTPESRKLEGGDTFVAEKGIEMFFHTTLVRIGLMRFTSIASAVMLAGCATWHDNTLNAQQLMASDCQSLAQEEIKLANNAEHLSQASGASTFAAVLLAALAGVAGTDGTPDAGVSESAINQGSLADETRARGDQIRERQSMVRALRIKKGCVQ